MISIGFYPKKFIFFTLLIALVAGGIYFYSKQTSQASIENLPNASTTSGAYNITVNIQEDGTTLVNGEKINKLLEPGKDYATFRYIPVDANGQYINFLQVSVVFPEAISEDTVQPVIYAIHGLNNSDTTYFFKDAKTLVYQAQNIGPQATFTVEAKISNGIINFPWYKNLLAGAFNLPASIWLIISLAFPILALIILIVAYFKTSNVWRVKPPKEVISKPPSDLAPALVGVLIDGKVSAYSIAATIIDLAHRNYLNIINKGNNIYSFGRKSYINSVTSTNQNGLNTYEKVLLSKIFQPESIKSSQEDIQIRIGGHVFSKKIAEVYLAIYEDVTRRGYFVKNPSIVHASYRRIGLILFFVGIVGFVLGIWLTPDPKFLLFFWAAMIFSSFLIIKIAPQFPALTPLGVQARQEWLKFRNYLTDKKPIDYNSEAQEAFEKYLPYAVSMGCEAEWAQRFFDYPFRSPDWYASYKTVTVIEDFITGLFPMISYISKELASSKEPIVE